MNSSHQQLHERAVKIAREYLRCERELLDILQELDRSHGARALGYSSLFDYCVKALGLSESVTYCLITVARKAIQVPELKESLGRGELTLTNAKRVAPILTRANQEQWLAKAKVLPRAQLEREIAKEFPKLSQPERVKPIAENRMAMNITISSELFDQLKRIQDLESTRQKKPATFEEAIQVAVQTHLHKHDPIQKAERARLKTKPINTVATVSRHSSGRRAPVPASIKHTVALREQDRCTAQTPNGRCESKRWLHLHHIQPVSKGGQNTPQNLTLLCSAHHAALHGVGSEHARNLLNHVSSAL